jgi:hypothetical protein
MGLSPLGLVGARPAIGRPLDGLRQCRRPRRDEGAGIGIRESPHEGRSNELPAGVLYAMAQYHLRSP